MDACLSGCKSKSDSRAHPRVTDKSCQIMAHNLKINQPTFALVHWRAGKYGS